MNLAVGVMARAPLPGGCKTRLLAVYDRHWVADLYAAMLGDTLDAFGRLDAVTRIVFVAPSDDERAEAALEPHVPRGWQIVVQRGDDLGARIEHAFGVLFTSGADCALVSGSDAPTLALAPLNAALSSMGDGRDEVLLAPCDDGGYSLVALTRPQPRLFASMPWSTPRVLGETRERALAAGLQIRELPNGYDVDAPADVARLAEELRRAPERAPRTAAALKTRAATTPAVWMVTDRASR